MKVNNLQSYLIKSLQKHDTAGFDVEDLRKKLLKEGKTEELLLTYSRRMPEIKDINTPEFWDTRFAGGQEHHPMEDDRISIVLSEIKYIKRIHNIGVGKGKLESEGYPKYKNSHSWNGTDFTNKTLSLVRSRYTKWKFKKTIKISEQPYKDASFDAVLLLEVLEHISPFETLKVLKEINRLLIKGGKFIVSVPINEGLREMYPVNPNGHLRIYSEELLIFELIQSGFRVNKIIRLSAFHDFYLIKKFINRFIKRWKSNNIILIATKL